MTDGCVHVINNSSWILHQLAVGQQREGMGLLEYQAIPSLCDIAHDGLSCKFHMEQQLNIPSARSWAAPVRATGTVRACLSRKTHTYRVTLLQPDRLAAVLGQPSGLQPHWLAVSKYKYTCYTERRRLREREVEEGAVIAVVGRGG
jgi:hypothetical protein